MGGTIKIGTYEKVSIDESDISDQISKNLHDGMVTAVFGISDYTSKKYEISSLSKAVKEKLSDSGLKSRYVLPRNEQFLKSIVVAKQEINEFVLLENPETHAVYLGKTQAVQDSELWGNRDMGRPYADSYSGMLPLKVARMMINLAIVHPKDQLTLLDPFCGMGTILSEGLLCGHEVIGSDNDPVVIHKAEKNVAWLRENSTSEWLPVSKLFVCEAVRVSEKITAGSVSAIVTEPFMGTPFENSSGKLRQKGKPVSQKQVKNTIKGLEKLYIGALKDWKILLSPHARVVITLPSIEYENRTYFVKKVIDNCEKLGYTIARGPFTYSRPQAIVKRNIFVLEKIT